MYKYEILYIIYRYTHSRILFSYKNEKILTFLTWVNMNVIMLGKINQSKKTNTVWFHSYVE